MTAASANAGTDWTRLPMLCGGTGEYTHWPAPMIYERRGRGIRGGALYKCSLCGSRRFAWLTMFRHRQTWAWKTPPHIQTAGPAAPASSDTMTCPSCRERSLQIRAAMELPPDAGADEISLQIVGCVRCAFEAVAVYEASRRGAGESSHHDWYTLRQDKLAVVAAAIAGCPSPSQRSCQCAAHQRLGAQGRSLGNWLRLENMEIELWTGGPIQRAGRR